MIKQTPLPSHVINCRRHGTDRHNQSLDLSRPHIMGILNVTPDSFSDGGKYHAYDAALVQCEQMIAAGASIIDVGGESTRPNATPVSESEETSRVVPIVEAIAQRFDVVISVDTSTPSVMQSAYEAGAHIWNDVRALTRSGARELAAKLDIPVILMHSRGEPDTMMTLTHYDNVVEDVMAELSQNVQLAQEAGVQHQNMILDVGFGFAKTTPQNLQLLGALSQFHQLGCALMIGLSRKRMLADTLAYAGLDNRIEDRITIGVVAAVLAVQQGVSIIRSHDVLETAQALALMNAMRDDKS